MMRTAATMLLLIVASLPLDAQSVTFRYFYDANGQLFRVADSAGNVVEYDYDANGNPTQIQRSNVAPGSLAILNIVPLSGLPGQTIAIYGQNFSPTAGNNTVKINGLNATVLSATATTLVVQIPDGVTSGPVTVTVGGNTVSSLPLTFSVPNVPTITSITPAYGSIGQTLQNVTVQGANLDGATFSLGTGGVITNVNAAGTQASFTLHVGAIPGPYTLLATADSGASSSVPTEGNTFRVYFPPGDNFAELRFSTFNTAYPPGYTPNVPPGSNEAFQLFSTQNNAGGTPPVPQLTLGNVSDARVRISPGGRGSLDGSALIAGQTIPITIGSPMSLVRFLQLEVDGVTLASSANGALETWFTVPHGVDSLELKAAGQTVNGLESDSPPQRVGVVADSGRVIAGRVVDANGQPVARAVVTWQANGLAAEYFRFNEPLAGIPDLAGRTAERTGYVTALNYPNPRALFGADPMGVGLGASYAARFHGKLLVPAAGVYQFAVRAHAGARLSIDGKLVEAAGVDLEAGAHDVEVVYFGDQGAAALELLWTRPGANQEVVPPAALQSEALTGWTAVTGGDGRFALRIPAALDGVAVKLAGGAGSVELESDITNRVR